MNAVALIDDAIKAAIRRRVVERHNHSRYHESLRILTLADTHFGRG